jgi:acyl-CoA synthetase (AMP-forming)/AMP-acid ligase II
MSLNYVLPTMMRGGTNVLLAGFQPEGFLAQVEREHVTSAALVPTMIYRILDSPAIERHDLGSLRTLVYGGSPMTTGRLREAIERFGPIFTQVYGGTEPGPVSCLRKEDHRMEDESRPSRLASAGRPFFYVDVSIQDDADTAVPGGEVGEICSRSPGQMTTYWDRVRNDEAMRRGWVHSGDIGFLDEDGYLYIVDRKKDMIVTGGFNVFPRQIEDVLATHPAVALAVVIGVPDADWGEAVKAVVQLKPGMSVSTEELRELVRLHKGPVWTPKSVELANQIPLTAQGKPDKKAVRAPYWTGQDRLVH